MINCHAVLPSINKVMRFPGGMKSGWCLTAQDNTFIHLCMVKYFIRKAGLEGKLFALVYGDDVYFYANAD